ncbi:MAG: hypothetical protein AAF413_04170 [Patescibacteria group bacterium]
MEVVHAAGSAFNDQLASSCSPKCPNSIETGKNHLGNWEMHYSCPYVNGCVALVLGDEGVETAFQGAISRVQD